jgi:transposase
MSMILVVESQGACSMSTVKQPLLFSDSEIDTPPTAGQESETPNGERRPPRINRPERTQGRMICESLDQRLDSDHPVRVVWSVVEGLDLSVLYGRIEAREGSAGRDASDPRVLFALCLYAAVDGISSARELERLSHEHRAYEWLRGEVPVNYHMLSDFRVEHGELLKQLQTDSLASMLVEGLVELNCAAQDGMRVRANAGSSSFRRLPSLEEAQRQAHEHLDKLEQEAENGAGEQTLRQQKARGRAAIERQERVSKAIEAAKQMAEQREKRKKGDGAGARASTTDPEARKMKMGDGGFVLPSMCR